MKKRVLAALLAGCMILLAGCKGEERVDYSQYCTLGEYKGLTIDAVEVQEVTDEDVEEQIQLFCKSLAEEIEITDRPVREGDTVNIDFKGYIDGEAFEGGEGSYDLEIGSGAFIEGFEEGLIGAEIGETRDVNTKFPESYPNNPDLSGKEAVFTVTVNTITAYDVPEFTDELVAENMGGITTTAEYIAYFKDSLAAQYEENAESEFRTNLIAKIVENATFDSYPEDLMEIYQAYWSDYVDYLMVYSGYSDAESFLAAMGMTRTEMEDWIIEMSEESCRTELVYYAIAKAEGIEVSDEEIEEALAADAMGAGLSEEEYKETNGVTENDYYLNLLSEKVLDFLKENTIQE